MDPVAKHALGHGILMILEIPRIHENLRNRGVGHTLRRGRDQGDPTPAQIPRKALVILPFRGRRTGPKSARDRKSMKTLG